MKRESFPDGYTIVHFTNNDIKQTLPNGTIIYFFADANTTQTTLPNGPNVYFIAIIPRFTDSQTNRLKFTFRMDQRKLSNYFPFNILRFSDGTEKFIRINGEEETMFSDGIF